MRWVVVAVYCAAVVKMLWPDIGPAAVWYRLAQLAQAAAALFGTIGLAAERRYWAYVA